MAVSQADIDALNAAIATGERQVMTGSKSVLYRSIDELIRARDDLLRQQAAEAAQQTGQPVARHTRLYHGGRGFD